VQTVPFACPESDTDFYNSQFSRSRQLNSNRSEDHRAARSPMGAGMQGFGVLTRVQFEQRAVTSSPPFGTLPGKHNRGLLMAEQRHSPARWCRNGADPGIIRQRLGRHVAQQKMSGCHDNNRRCSIVVSTARCGFTSPSRPMFDSWHRQLKSLIFFAVIRCRSTATCRCWDPGPCTHPYKQTRPVS
jgi:hypothetical protein